jgi:hypothetical protein
MQFFESNDLTSTIYHRAMSLYISKEFAHTQKGEIYIAKYQESEQAHRRRELLDVEQKTNNEKMLQQYGEAQFVAQVTKKFYDKLSQKITTEFNNKENLFSQRLKIESAASDILELLAVNAASIKRITPLASSLPWLANELLTLVNKPQYRKRSTIKVSDSSLAVSYVGLENLKMVMPTFILKHWLPTSTEPFPTLKRKIWQDSLSIGMASRVLAKYHDLNEYDAFTAAMLSNIGVFAICRSYTELQQDMHQADLKEAYDKRDKVLHDALTKMGNDPELLFESLIKYSSQLAADMVELMRFEHLRITETIFDLAHTDNLSKMSDLAQIIIKAKAYVVYRNLSKDELIDDDEAKNWLSSSGINMKEITLLKRADIDHIKLKFD